MKGGSRVSPLALVGVGYMGGSLALAARRAGLCDRVVGYEVDPEAGAVALRRGIVDALADTPEAAVREAALVVLAAPVGALPGLVERIAGVVPQDAIVIDLGSVKAPVLQAAERTAIAARFVACHPLAGLEVSGPAHADAGLYDGKPCYVCPGPSTSAAALATAEALWRGIGSSLLRIEADRHDAFMAAASHLPHVGAFSVAASLTEVAELLEETIPPSCPPTSLRDTTRVAASSPITWRDIFLENRAHLLPLVESLEARVRELRLALERGDGAAIESLLREARGCRQRLVKS